MKDNIREAATNHPPDEVTAEVTAEVTCPLDRKIYQDLSSEVESGQPCYASQFLNRMVSSPAGNHEDTCYKHRGLRSALLIRRRGKEETDRAERTHGQQRSGLYNMFETFLWVF